MANVSRQANAFRLLVDGDHRLVIMVVDLGQPGQVASSDRIMARLFAYLSYRDALAAIAWLEAIGFVTTARQTGDVGAVLHAELKLGDAVVILATADAAYTVPPLEGQSTGGGLYLFVDDVRAIYSAAIDAGATAVLEPAATEWGSERARVLDPEGHEWSFGSYQPGGTW
jgi:uncharacterized glyoxalase superfamily protein PhnB